MSEGFGERVRRARTARDLGLREAAGRLGISAAYLSRIETNQERTPPAEKVIKDMAELYGENFDDLMSLAGRVPSDVSEFITSQPGLPQYLRTVKSRGLTPQELNELLSKSRK